MMLSPADFEELFAPDEVSRQTAERGGHAGAPPEARLARWEDGGGLTPRAPPPPFAPNLRPPLAAAGHDPLRITLALSLMPAAAAFGATSVMMALLGQARRA